MYLVNWKANVSASMQYYLCASCRGTQWFTASIAAMDVDVIEQHGCGSCDQ